MTFRKTASAIPLALLALTTACSQLPAQEDVDPLQDNCARANTLARSTSTRCLRYLYDDNRTLSEKQLYCDIAIRAINATTKACMASSGR